MSAGFEPDTERVDRETANLDVLEIEELVRVLLLTHQRAVDAAIDARASIARAVEEIVARLRDGGRLHYAGAGTSGRLGFLDATEMPPTFGSDPSLVCAHIAGGSAALTSAVEGAEDDSAAAESDLRDHVRARDALIAISAGGGAAYAVRAVEVARAHGAFTIALVNSAGSPLAVAADLAIVPETGAEPIAGSTRLKAGTAQKIVLNTISSAVMTRLGKVYQNLMVDVVASNQKLRRRAVRLVMRLAPASEDHAAELLSAARGSVKVAVVMVRCNLDEDRARALLAEHDDSLRATLSPQR